MAYKKSYTKTQIEKDRHKNNRNKKNNTCYSPTTIISTNNPATQLTYKKTYKKTQIDTQTQTQTRTQTQTQTQTKPETKREKNTDKDIVDKSDRRINKIVKIYI